MDPVRTDKAPAPVGCYEQAVVHGGIVYVSMQLPISAVPENNALQGAEDQADLVLRNIGEILTAAGSALDSVLRLTVYVTDISNARRVNAVCEKHFTTRKPARSMVTVTALPMGYNVAMEATAAVK